MRKMLVLLVAVLLLPVIAFAEQPQLPEPHAEAMQKFFDGLKEKRIIVSSTDYTVEAMNNGNMKYWFAPGRGLRILMLFKESGELFKAATYIDQTSAYAISIIKEINEAFLMAHTGMDEQTASDFWEYFSSFMKERLVISDYVPYDKYELHFKTDPMENFDYSLSIYAAGE